MVFLDTEFADLLQPKLLSIGMVAIPDRSFYAELDLRTEAGKARAKTSTDFISSGGALTQWGLIPESTSTQWEMGRRAGESQLGLAAEACAKVGVAFDYNVDFELLEHAIRESGLWDQVREVLLPVNVDSITGTITGELASESFYEKLAEQGKPGIRRHHALADALALREAYVAVKAQALSRAAEAQRKTA